jgi:hypothetical protein
MRIRTFGGWVGFLLAAGTLTGCAGSGSNSNFQRINSATARTQPAATSSVAAAPANNSAWNRQPQAAMASTTKPGGDPSALAAPTGNTPQLSNQPTGGITPAGGIAPPAALPASGSVPAVPAPASGSSTSNLLPIGSSGNAGTPMSAATSSNKPVVTAAARPTESAPKALPAVTADDSSVASGPTMPPAANGSELPVTMPKPITSLSALAPPPPTTVRQ